MKKMILFLLSISFACNADNFNYFTAGGYVGTGSGLDFSLGHRRIAGHHAWDINAGATMIQEIQHTWPYLQSSYFFYPEEDNGPYIGSGLTVIPLGILLPKYYPYSDVPFMMNIPLTVGYQAKKSKQFVQFQFGLFNQSASLSYGLGF